MTEPAFEPVDAPAAEARVPIVESETDEYVDVLVTCWHPGGSVTRYIEREWKTGTRGELRRRILGRLERLSELLSAADKSWPELTAAQREGAIRLAVRAAANLSALAADVLDDDPGEGG